MSHTLIIAEAGVNHNGSLLTAKRLVDAAAEAGVDIDMMTGIYCENLCRLVREGKISEDLIDESCMRILELKNKRNIGDGDDLQLAMLKSLELSEADHYELVAYCREKGIRFWSTAFDMESLDFLHSLNLGLWKIPSGEITNYPFIKKIASFGEPVIMSTGMCDEDDIRNAMAVLTDNGLRREQITILHCNTQYPTPMADVNLRAMLTIKRDFGVEVGYSDHTQGIEVPIAAVALGAAVVEKHFTLDRAMKRPDHKASLEPKELKAMTAAIRNIEQALGTGEKCVSASERANIAVARKSIVAACTVKKGDILTDGNLAVKRPGTGISPMRWNEVVGTRASKDFEPDEMIVL